MKKYIYLFFLMPTALLFSQVGVGVVNPQATFHVDGAKDNPATGLPTVAQQLNDFVVTSQGFVGIGTTTPFAPITFSNNLVSGRKISMYYTGVNDHQYYGFGVFSNVQPNDTFINQIDNTGAKFSWRSGTGVATSNDLMTLTGDGKLGLGTTTPANMLTVNGGKFQYMDGTQRNAYVLTSNSTGQASWLPYDNSVNYLHESDMGIGADIPNTLGAGYVYTGTSLLLPPGKWKVTVNLAMTKGSTTAANESWWLNSTFADSSSATTPSSDIFGRSSFIAGLLPGNSMNSMLTGDLFINNTSSTDKLYYYIAGNLTTDNATGQLNAFGSTGENNIIIYQQIN